MSDTEAQDDAQRAPAPQAPEAMAAAAGAPPLGTRPAEPLPGKASLADPQGRQAAGADGDGDGGVCPDCGLPYKDHPDFAGGRDPAHGHGHGQGHHAFDPRDVPGSPAADERHLPGEELDQRNLGGDPAEA